MSSFSLLTDAAGNPCAGTFGQVLPTSNLAGVSTGASAGLPVGGINPGNRLTPLAIDAYGSLTIRPGVCPTWTASAQAVTTGTTANKCMLSIYNGSQTTWTRLVWLIAQCPPQVNTTTGLAGIGSGTTYTQVLFGMYRITGHTGGTALPRVAADPSDDSTLDTAVSVATGASVTGKAAAPSYIWDAAYNGSMAIGPRPDICTKVHTLPPGNGIGIFCISALGTSVNFLLSATCAQNIA